MAVPFQGEREWSKQPVPDGSLAGRRRGEDPRRWRRHDQAARRLEPAEHDEVPEGLREGNVFLDGQVFVHPLGAGGALGSGFIFEPDRARRFADADRTGSGGGTGGSSRRGGGASTAVTSPTTVVALPSASDVINERNAEQQIANNLLNTPDPTINRTAPFTVFSGGKPFQDIGEIGGKLGLEPNEFLNQKQSYLEHLNQLRRINLGADNSDAAGYGLYLVNVPVSIQPGECSYKGHGASMTVTAKHFFGPNFLPETYRIFVINDLVDILTPVVYEMIRSGYVDEMVQREVFVTTTREAIARKHRELEQKKAELRDKQVQVVRRMAEFMALKPVLARNVSYFVDNTLKRINTALNKLIGTETLKGHEIPFAARVEAIAEAIEIVHEIVALIPVDPDLQRIDSKLLQVFELMRKANRQTSFSPEEKKFLTNASRELVEEAKILPPLIQRGMLQIATPTLRGKSALLALMDIQRKGSEVLIGPTQDDAFTREMGPRIQTRWKVLFGEDVDFARDLVPHSERRILAPQSYENNAIQRRPLPDSKKESLDQKEKGLDENNAKRDQKAPPDQPNPLEELTNIIWPLLATVSDRDVLTSSVAQLPAQIASIESQVSRATLQSGVPLFTKWIGTFLPLTRSGTDYYPIALTDYDKRLPSEEF